MEAASVPAAADAAHARRRRSAARRARARPGGCGSPSFAIVVFCLFPFYWLVNTSLKTGPDLSTSALVPPNPTLDNYESIFKDSNFTIALQEQRDRGAGDHGARRSSSGSFCAYALARLKIKFKFLILAIVLSITTFPQITIAAPIFKLWRDIGLYNTDPGPGHPVPDVRAPAGDLHPHVVLPGDPEGPRGGGARRRGDELPGVLQGRRAARGARPGHRGHPDVHRGLERVPAGDHADLVDRTRARSRPRSRSSRGRRSSSSRWAPSARHRSPSRYR